MNKPETYDKAVETIKTAILQGQYEAAKGVNRIQLAVYFGIGKYISLNTRKGKWGTGALEAISQQLRKELPGLRGFSASSMKNMRLFYEEWIVLDPDSLIANDMLKSPITIGDLQNTDNHCVDNLPITIGEMKDYVIDIYQAIQIPETKDFPIEDFFKVPFTHHIRSIKGS